MMSLHIMLVLSASACLLLLGSLLGKETTQTVGVFLRLEFHHEALHLGLHTAHLVP